MLWKLNQRTFNGGQLDRRLMGRTDLAKYYEGASELKNFLVKRQGCIVKRRGTVRLADVSDDLASLEIGTPTAWRLFPFSYENDFGYSILFIGNAAESVALVYGKDGARKSMLSIPYGAAQFAQISSEQSGDMLYLAHQSHPFARIVRNGDTDWIFEPIDFSRLGHAELPATPTIEQIDQLGSGWPDSEDAPERTVTYYATSVKDGIESPLSEGMSKTYKAPWPEGGLLRVLIREQTPAPDYYNVYKETDQLTGFIGTARRIERTDIPLPSAIIGEDMRLLEHLDSYGNQIYASPSVVESGSEPQVAYQDAVNSNTEKAIVVQDGICTFEYDTAVDIGEIKLSLGFTWYCCAWNSNGQHQGWVQYVPCKVELVAAVATLEDDTTVALGAKLVREDARATSSASSAWRTPYSSSSDKVWSVIRNARETNTKNQVLSWTVNLTGANAGKKIKKVTFNASPRDEDPEIRPELTVNSPSHAGGSVRIEGYPFTISGYWAKLRVTEPYTLVDDYITPDASLTPPKYEPHFEQTGKFPGCVAMYQQRLALASTEDQPFTFWLSCIGDLYNFNTHESVRDDDAMEVTLPVTKYPDINHMVLNRDLIMFCDSGEWIVAPVSGNALTHKTVSTKMQSQAGCSKVLKPITINEEVVFAGMTAETLMATKYSYATDGYEMTDLSVLSQDMFRGNGITSIAYKQHPDSLIVATLRDGTFATLSYMKEHEVVSWSRHELGGGLKALCCCADGSVTDGTTDVYILAKAANGALYLLRIKEDSPLDTVENAVAMDDMCERTYDRSWVVESGFRAVDALTGAEVAAGGTLTARRRYIIGRPFEARFVSVKPEPNAKETVQFELKNPTEVEVRVTDGSTFKVGQLGLPEERDRTMTLAPTITAGTGALTLRTEDVQTLIAGANGRDGRIRLTSDGVWPLSVLSIATTYQIELANQDPQDPKGGGE